MRVKDFVLTSVGLLILVASYVVPFTLLRESRDLTLYMFWLSLVVVSFLTSLAYLRGEEGE